MSSRKIAIYGGGGFAREVAWLIEACNQNTILYDLVCFIDDNRELQGQVLNEVPVFSFEEACRRFPQANIVWGIGSPKTREFLMPKAQHSGMDFETIIHPRVERSQWVEIGAGTVICAGNILTTNIKLGKHVQINLDCTIGHDVTMDDFATLAPGVHVSGCVHLGKRVYVGTGAVIINGTQTDPIVIGDDAVIGAGACVTKSVPPNLTVVGVPARPIQR